MLTRSSSRKDILRVVSAPARSLQRRCRRRTVRVRLAQRRPGSTIRRAESLPALQRCLGTSARSGRDVSARSRSASLIARYSRRVQVKGLQYGDPMGLPELRETIAVYLRTARGVQCEAGQIMIVSGSQQALDLTTRVIVDPGAAVWVEEPGYWTGSCIMFCALPVAARCPCRWMLKV